MERRHIAVFTPFAAGHVYPALGLCSELASRGHYVTYPTNETFAAKVRDAGATAIQVTVPEVRHAEKIVQDSTLDDARYWRAFTSVFCPMFMATGGVIAAQVEEFYAANPPDLVLYEWWAFGGRLLAKRLRCRAGQLHAHFAHHDSLMRIDGVCKTPEPMVAFAELLDAFMATYGFDERGHLKQLENLNICFVPKEFQYDSDALASRFAFVGATHNRKPRPGMWKNRAENGKPLLLISENTSSRDGRFYSACVAAFADSPYHVVFSKGLSSPEVSSASLPHNFEINREAFNCEILPFASVLMCQSGIGTVLESLHHGVPVVAVPPNPFNSEVAYRMDELGLGVHVPQRDMTPEVLRRAVDAAYSDEALRERVKRMQSTLERTPGAKEAADLVEEYLA